MTTTPGDDQQAAERREGGRRRYRAMWNGQEVTLRPITVDALRDAWTRYERERSAAS